MIETSRLLLLPYTYELVEATLKGKRDLENVLNYKVSNEWPSPQYLKLIKMKKDKLHQTPEQSIWSRIAIHKESGTLIGEIGCKGGPNEQGTVEIGYGMVSEARNKGFATEMVIGLTDWLAAHPKVKRVTAECLVTNTPSAKVLEKSGFKLMNKTDEMLNWEKI
ncbi:GNAT family N-acetyltransferase [Fictibacillus sp. UD]|uniref:GNAT family N-acetyltransferase n=1 Tax=Fictibacillus sp. UD TaxID=3038777 RepID=UPI00374756C5